MLSRNTLAVNLRFLDNAINKLPLKPSIITETVATDGRYIFYDESYVLKSYKSGYNLTRAYLHMMLHCVFRHNIVGTLVDTLRWNLACDIAAENIMNELDIKALSSPRQVRQGSIIDKIKTACRFVTAEKIYDYLLRNVDDLQVYAGRSCLRKTTTESGMQSRLKQKLQRRLKAIRTARTATAGTVMT